MASSPNGKKVPSAWESEVEYESFPSVPSNDEADARTPSGQKNASAVVVEDVADGSDSEDGSNADGQVSMRAAQSPWKSSASSAPATPSVPSITTASMAPVPKYQQHHQHQRQRDAANDETEMVGLSSRTTTTSKAPSASAASANDSSFDPYKPSAAQKSPAHVPPRAESLVNIKGNSLIDDQASVATVDSASTRDVLLNPPSNSVFPGTAGYLEIEEEPPRRDPQHSVNQNRAGVFRSSGAEEPIKTSSGLLLTHRKSPTARLPERNPPRTALRPSTLAYGNADGDGGAYNREKDNHGHNNGHDCDHDYDGGKRKDGNGIGIGNLAHRARNFVGGSASVPPPTRRSNRDHFEVENGQSWSRGFAHSPQTAPTMALLRAKRLLSFVKVWMVVAGALLLAFTAVIMHSFGHSDSDASATVPNYANVNNPASSGSSNPGAAGNQHFQMNEQVLLLPLAKENISQLGQRQEGQQPLQMALPGQHLYQQRASAITNNHRVLLELEDEMRQQFEHWIHHHGKQYHSHDEKEHRFHVWAQNHERTKSKNLNHGPCKMTNRDVFGSNGLQDLTHEEFKSKYLTGYKGLMGEDWHHHQKHRHVGPKTRKLSHGSGKVMDPAKRKPNFHPSVKHRVLGQKASSNGSQVRTSSGSGCVWYDISCWLRYLFYSAGIGFGVGTMEPQYDSDSYPIAVDWRDYGATTDVKAQGECGACWAITAVETIESATFLSTGSLYDLAETEVIMCDDTCEMCSGGWPQNAFEWVMEHNGLLLEENMAYDDEYLLGLTEGMEGTSDVYTADSVSEYAAQICPAEGDSHDSKDNNNNNDGDDGSNQYQRYGQIDGYGYATDRCLCYTDGSGCDCDKQDEALAVRNVASYGPATVCLEASLWQDYAGGIITSDLGCTSAFLDMNHCVQVVGYAFNEVDEDGEMDNRDLSSNSNSNSGSGDEANREGYWIVRNQWGNSWGMNGYAYVAMGDNTCGVLNDMTQVYSD